MSDDILNSRRALRVPARCLVRAEAASSTWSAETEDVGPNGCRLVGPPLQSGQVVHLEITSPNVRRVLEATGRVAWASAGRPFTCGVVYDEAARPLSHRWFDRLVADDPELLLHGGLPDKVGLQTVIYLGEPPARPGRSELSADELEVLRLVGDGQSMGQLRHRLSATWARSRRVLLALLSREHLTVNRAEAVGAAAWQALLQAPANAAGPSRRPTDPGLPAIRRTAEAQAAFDEGRKALAEGRLGSARALLSHAALLAPGDAEIRKALDKAMWGISG